MNSLKDNTIALSGVAVPVLLLWSGIGFLEMLGAVFMWFVIVMTVLMNILFIIFITVDTDELKVTIAEDTNPKSLASSIRKFYEGKKNRFWRRMVFVFTSMLVGYSAYRIGWTFTSATYIFFTAISNLIILPIVLRRYESLLVEIGVEDENV